MLLTFSPGRARLGATLVGALGVLALALALALYGEAHAASATVGVGTPTNRFTPNIANISTGDKVTFTWSAGTHVVDLKDVSPDIQVDSAHTSGVTTAFATPGTYYYYCSVHATADQATEAHVQANDAMVGKIVVTAASTGGSTATTAPGAPSTGSGTMDGSSTTGMWLAAAGIGLLAAAGGILALRRR